MSKAEGSESLRGQEEGQKIVKKNGHWNKREHDTYLLFFTENATRQKGQRLFKRLSQLIGTRTPS